MTNTDRVWEMASKLEHGFILTEALTEEANDDGIDLKHYGEVAVKISEIEKDYTEREIEAGNLLCDLW